MTLHHLLVLTPTSSTTAAASKSSGSSFGFLIIILVLVALYFLIIRPRTQRQRQARTQASTVAVGDSVMTVGGIKGVVVGTDDTDVQVEVAPGVVMTFIRRAVNVQPAAATPQGSDPAGVIGGDDHELGDGHNLGSDGGTVDDEGPDDRPGTGIEDR